MTETPDCRVCGGREGRLHGAREMMFGLRERFDYLECERCGCVQIVEPPADLGRYYPEDYYSFGEDLDAEFTGDAARQAGKAVRALLSASEAVSQDSGWRDLRRPLLSLRRLDLGAGQRVLDVGCGSGRLLYLLRLAGWTELLGVDAFLPADRRYANGLEIRRATLAQVDGGWDTIMFHHAFEHLPDPQATLQEVVERLAPGGVCLLRLPLADSEAWTRYGVDWVQLDAPRHLFLHTRRSLERLAADAGLAIDAIVHDSYELQFWGSEQYRQDIPLLSEGSYRWGAGAPLFSAAQIAAWREESEMLNRAGRGDQAAVYLRRA